MVLAGAESAGWHEMKRGLHPHIARPPLTGWIRIRAAGQALETLNNPEQV